MIYSKETKALENRARRAAARQGYRLVRNAARDPLAIGFGAYSLVATPPRRLHSPELDPRRGQFEVNEVAVLENVPLADVIAKLRLPMQP
jgi:hypothetical protein